MEMRQNCNVMRRHHTQCVCLRVYKHHPHCHNAETETQIYCSESNVFRSVRATARCLCNGNVNNFARQRWVQRVWQLDVDRDLSMASVVCWIVDFAHRASFNAFAFNFIPYARRTNTDIHVGATTEVRYIVFKYGVCIGKFNDRRCHRTTTKST